MTLLARILSGIALLFMVILLLAAVSTFVSHRLASVLGGVVFAAAIVWLAARRDGARTPEGAVATGSPASAKPELSSVARDVDRVLAWCRTVVRKRIPERGYFEPLSETLQPEAQPLSGLMIHLAATPFSRNDPADTDVRVLTIKVEGEEGAYLQTDVDMGTAAQLVARLDVGERTAWLTGLLERAAEELPRDEGG